MPAKKSVVVRRAREYLLALHIAFLQFTAPQREKFRADWGAKRRISIGDTGRHHTLFCARDYLIALDLAINVLTPSQREAFRQSWERHKVLLSRSWELVEFGKN